MLFCDIRDLRPYFIPRRPNAALLWEPAYNRSEFPIVAAFGHTLAAAAREKRGSECPRQTSQGCRWKRLRLPCFVRSTLERKCRLVSRLRMSFSVHRESKRSDSGMLGT